MLNLIKKLLVGKDHLAYLPQGSDAPSLTKGSLETIELPHICSMFNQPYIARYARHPGALYYEWVEAVRIETMEGGRGAAAALPVTFNADDFDSRKDRCPWCGAQDIVVCDSCRQLVCEGKVKRTGRKRYFYCRDSCGAEGWLEPYHGPMYGSRATAEPLSRPERSQVQQAASQGNRPALQADTRKASLPANSNARALPVPSNRRLLK